MTLERHAHTRKVRVTKDEREYFAMLADVMKVILEELQLLQRGQAVTTALLCQDPNLKHKYEAAFEESANNPLVLAASEQIRLLEQIARQLRGQSDASRRVH